MNQKYIFIFYLLIFIFAFPSHSLAQSIYNPYWLFLSVKGLYLPIPTYKFNEIGTLVCDYWKGSLAQLYYDKIFLTKYYHPKTEQDKAGAISICYFIDEWYSKTGTSNNIFPRVKILTIPKSILQFPFNNVADGFINLESLGIAKPKMFSPLRYEILNSIRLKLYIRKKFLTFCSLYNYKIKVSIGANVLGNNKEISSQYLANPNLLDYNFKPSEIHFLFEN